MIARALIQDSQNADKPLEHFEMMMATNLHERTEAVLGAKVLNEPEVFPFILEHVQKVLTPEDWEALKARLGVNQS